MDASKAVEWYQKAAAQGNASAEAHLGSMYDLGFGVTKDTAKAMDLFQKSAAQGNAEAQEKIGEMYAYGDGVTKDSGKAMEWFNKAADQGYSRAMYLIGYMYHEGNGLPQDFGKAMIWYRKAAEQGDAIAQCEIGAMYYEGEGVPKDPGIAFQWFKKGADNGDAQAMYSIGNMYENGEWVPKDFTQAQQWFKKGDDADDPEIVHGPRVNIISSAPLKKLNDDEQQIAMMTSVVGTPYHFVKMNGDSQIILSDTAERKYEINISATDYKIPSPSTDHLSQSDSAGGLTAGNVQAEAMDQTGDSVSFGWKVLVSNATGQNVANVSIEVSCRNKDDIEIAKFVSNDNAIPDGKTVNVTASAVIKKNLWQKVDHWTVKISK